MSDTILITGGAGFIGSHLADALLAHGYRVRVYDNLTEQVHGPDSAFDKQWPAYLNPDVERIHGDIRDRDRLRHALRGVDAVYHFAAAVGVGQSMYQIEKYTDVNNRGTAVLLEGLLKQRVERLIVASSMSLYGEGAYETSKGEEITPGERSSAQCKSGLWELQDGNGHALIPVPTTEDKRPQPASIYALSKYDQERMCLLFGQAYDLPVVALRFFNVYGPRQALSNPYTGVLAIFSARILNNKSPLIFEDGRQRRDFVSVHDVAQACRLALETPGAAGQAFNVGAGRAWTVLEIAERIARVLGRDDIEAQITGSYRAGDIRHCFAATERARTVLGYAPQVELEDGLEELAEWLQYQQAGEHFEAADRELAQRGLRV